MNSLQRTWRSLVAIHYKSSKYRNISNIKNMTHHQDNKSNVTYSEQMLFVAES